MKVVFVSNLMSISMKEKIFRKIEKKPLQSIQKFNRLLCEGIDENNIKVKAITSLPITPKISSKKIWIESKEIENGIEYSYLPFINIKFIRNICIFIFMFLSFLKENIFNKENKIFICDILNTTMTFVTLMLSKIFRVKCIGLVTDLPRDINSGTLSNKINQFMQNKFDGYIFLTKQMNDIINSKNKPYIVIEGISEATSDKKNIKKQTNAKKICMYAGGLYEKYGVKDLIDAFVELDVENIELHLYGSGDLEEYIKEINNKKIKYFGIVNNEEIVKKEKEVTILINPRYSNEEYTKYSFPSKNMEYMSSGTPVLTTKLKGIPDEYFNYCYVIEKENKKGIKKALLNILNKTSEELNEVGSRAKDFVLNKKNKKIQGKKIADFINNNYNNNKKFIINNKFFQFYLIFLMVCFLFLSRNSLYTSLYLTFEISYFILLFLFLPLIILYLKNLRKLSYIQQRNFNIMLCIDIIFLLIILLKNDFALYNFTNIITLNVAFIFSQMINNKNFRKWFIIIILFLSITSLFNIYVLRYLIINNHFEQYFINSPLYKTNTVNTPFINFITSFVVWENNYIRNFSIFSEPAFFQFYIIIAMLLLHFSNYKKIYKVFGHIILGITMISTFSSGGLIAYLLFMAYVIVSEFFKKNKKQRIMFILSLMILFATSFKLLLSIDQIKVMLDVSINKIITINDSSVARYGSIIYSIKNLISSPVLGVKIIPFLTHMNITNTTFSIFAIYGLFFGMLYINLIIKISNEIKENKISSFIIFVILFITTTNHIFLGVQSFWIIMLSILFISDNTK